MSSSQSLSSENLQYIESLYALYKSDPQSVEPKWRDFFSGVDFATATSGTTGGGLSLKELNVYNLIQAYRDYGHFQAQLDPLSMRTPSAGDLALQNFGLSDKDLATTFSVSSIVGLKNATL